MDKTQSRVAVIACIVRDGADTDRINALLHDAGRFIIGRMGIPHRARGVNIISVAIDAPQDVISTLSGRIGALEGVTAKTAYSDVIGRI